MTESSEELLRKLANGGIPDSEIFTNDDVWPRLLEDILDRIIKTTHNDFPIPRLDQDGGSTPRRTPSEQQAHSSALASSPPMGASGAASPDDSNKENTNSSPQRPTENAALSRSPTPSLTQGDLPTAIFEMLDEVVSTLRMFPEHPPHTIQRLAEIVLSPQEHYRALASYLHALDRVVHVTSGSNIYPLPLSVADLPTSNGLGDVNGSAMTLWGNTTTTAGIGSDEALGGALLTPVPWLNKQSDGEDEPVTTQQGHAELRTESTETIDGPHGAGSLETVTANGVGTLHSNQQQPSGIATDQENNPDSALPMEESTDIDDEETPHARGPDEIGANDLGPQTHATPVGSVLSPEAIDTEVAVGLKSERQEPAVESEKDTKPENLSKRHAEDDTVETNIAKRARSEDRDLNMDDAEPSPSDTT